MNSDPYYNPNNSAEELRGSLNYGTYSSLEEVKASCEEGKEVLLEYPSYNPETGELLNNYTLVKSNSKYTVFRYYPFNGRWYASAIVKKDSDPEEILIEFCKYYFEDKMMKNLKEACQKY